MTRRFPGFLLQETPRILAAGIPGKWLLERVTPSWRAKDLEEGWQRVVKKERVQEIARRVLDQRRTFPNAVVLGTDNEQIRDHDDKVVIPDDARFLVIDGQHRIYAQKWSEFEATYACVLHVAISEVEMAKLFIEINENQKRVPASLRWDLVRLIRPDDDPYGIRASEVIYELVTERRGSPLYQRVDLTGENPRLSLKQASLAPEIKNLLTQKKSPLFDRGELQVKVLEEFFAAVKEVDPDGWKTEEGVLYKARFLRALLQLLPDIMKAEKVSAEEVEAEHFFKRLKKIHLASLDTDEIRRAQGNAGIRAIREVIRKRVL